jgi:hypothetical protein
MSDTEAALTRRPFSSPAPPPPGDTLNLVQLALARLSFLPLSHWLTRRPRRDHHSRRGRCVSWRPSTAPRRHPSATRRGRARALNGGGARVKPSSTRALVGHPHSSFTAGKTNARAGLMGTLVRKKHLFLNASRSCLLGTLLGKKS